MRNLDGDVETIAGKALEKDPDRRYASAAALGEDVTRYLASQPILARPPSAAYQLRKLVQRHRVPAAFAAVLLVLLVGFGVAMAVLYGRSERNLRRAVVAEQEARENFDLARGAVDRYLTRVTESPEMEARGLEDLRRQLLATAREFYESLAERRAHSEELKAELGNAHHRLAWISRIVGDQDRAEEAYRDGIRTLENLVEVDPDNRSYRYTLAVLVSNLGLVLQETDRLDEAEVQYDRAIEMEIELLGEDPEAPHLRHQHGNTLDNFGQMLERAGRIEDAERRLRDAFDLRRVLAVDVPDDPSYRNVVLQSGVNLSGLYSRLGRLDEAEQVLSDALPLGESLVSENPRNAEFRHSLAAALGNLGGVEMLLGRFERSADAYRRELALREPLVLDHPSVLDYRLKLASTYTNLGELDTRTGRHETSLPWYDRSIETLGWVLDREPDHAVARFFISYTHAWKARSLDALGRHAGAVREWDLAVRYDDRGDPALKEARDRSRSLAPDALR